MGISRLLRVRNIYLQAMLIVCLLGLVASAGTPGSFRGYLLQGTNTKPGWVYIQSRNDMLRLVRIAGASVYYAETVPENRRRSNPAESLRPGAEVRITAQEDGKARWYAEEVEILNVAPTQQAQK